MNSALDTPGGYRVVTAGTLARNISKLLSEVQECPGLLVTRHGIPIAIVTPIERAIRDVHPVSRLGGPRKNRTSPTRDA